MEFVALLPIFVLVALALGQAAVAGYAQWSVAGAARVAARAEAVGADPQRAARAALPSLLHDELRVRLAPVRAARGDQPAVAAGTVEVRLRVPSMLPGLRLGTVRARAQLPAQEAA